jgi:hypothetical protein
MVGSGRRSRAPPGVEDTADLPDAIADVEVTLSGFALPPGALCPA